VDSLVPDASSCIKIGAGVGTNGMFRMQLGRSSLVELRKRSRHRWVAILTTQGGEITQTAAPSSTDPSAVSRPHRPDERVLLIRLGRTLQMTDLWLAELSIGKDPMPQCIGADRMRGAQQRKGDLSAKTEETAPKTEGFCAPWHSGRGSEGTGKGIRNTFK
jgi:hypothetical protein